MAEMDKTGRLDKSARLANIAINVKINGQNVQ